MIVLREFLCGSVLLVVVQSLEEFGESSEHEATSAAGVAADGTTDDFSDEETSNDDGSDNSSESDSDDVLTEAEDAEQRERTSPATATHNGTVEQETASRLLELAAGRDRAQSSSSWSADDGGVAAHQGYLPLVASLHSITVANSIESGLTTDVDAISSRNLQNGLATIEVLTLIAIPFWWLALVMFMEAQSTVASFVQAESPALHKIASRVLLHFVEQLETYSVHSPTEDRQCLQNQSIPMFCLSFVKSIAC